jgi:hypothetical protein
MALEDFLGRRQVKDSTTGRETKCHYVTISVAVACEGSHGAYPKMIYHPEDPERLEGVYEDGHRITITRRAKGIDCEIAGDAIDTGSWTADDPGTSGDGE